MVVHPRILDLAFEVRDIPTSPKLLLIVMSRLGNSTGQCFASQETLANRCCCSVRTVRRLLDFLRCNQFVTRIPNPKGSTDRYVLNFHRWGGAGGQNGRGERPKRLVDAGQYDRQNLDLNPKLNRSGAVVHPERSRCAVRLDRKMQDTLERIGEAVKKASAAGEADDD
jgi:hypothetical protein